MKNSNYIRYFRVFKNDTTVTQISTNDFKPLKLVPCRGNWHAAKTMDMFCAVAEVAYALPVSEPLFYGYLSQAKAMEMAKAGAMRYINSLIKEGDTGMEALLQYREDHYEDLHFNLLEASIQRVKG